jgi:hypothetical protein
MRIANQSEDWTFLMWQLGMIDQPKPKRKP